MRKYIFLILSFFTFFTLFAQDIDESVRENTRALVDSLARQKQAEEIHSIAPVAKFGFLSYNEAMKAMPEYVQAQNSLEKLKIYYDQEMERAEDEFSKKFSEYIDGYKSFPENIMLKRQKELQQLMEQSMAFKKEAQDLLTKSEKELMEPINAKLKEAIKTVGKEHKFSYILNTDANAYPFINTDEGEGIDVTDEVIKLVK